MDDLNIVFRDDTDASAMLYKETLPSMFKHYRNRVVELVINIQYDPKLFDSSKTYQCDLYSKYLSMTSSEDNVENNYNYNDSTDEEDEYTDEQNIESEVWDQ